MAKNYSQIITGFRKTIADCTRRSVELERVEQKKGEKASKLIAEGKQASQEREMTERLAAKLTELIGAEHA